MKLRPRLAVTLIASSLTLACAHLGTDREQEMNTALRAVATGSRPAYAANDPEGAGLWKKTQSLYEKRGFAAAWVEGAKPRPQMDELIEALRASAGEGLDPDLYNVSMLEERRKEASKGFLTDKGFDPKEAGALDVWLTYLYMKYASDIADGLSDLSHADPAWKIKSESFDAQAHLEKAIADGSIKSSLAELTPRAPEYRTAARAAGALQGAATEWRVANGACDQAEARSEEPAHCRARKAARGVR